MALIIQKEFDNGTVAKNCYAKIIDAEFINPTIKIRVGYFYNKESREKNLPLLATELYIVNNSDIPNDNRTDIYNYLKTLPEFKGAKNI
jgi:hypothetical protein